MNLFLASSGADYWKRKKVLRMTCPRSLFNLLKNCVSPQLRKKVKKQPAEYVTTSNKQNTDTIDSSNDIDTDNAEDNNFKNRKKVSLIEFLYKDKNPSTSTLKISTSEGTASIKLPNLRSWLRDEVNASENANPEKALVLYQPPFDVFKKTLHKYLTQTIHMFSDIFNNNTSPFSLTFRKIKSTDSNPDTMHTSIDIQDVTEDLDVDTDQRGASMYNGREVTQGVVGGCAHVMEYDGVIIEEVEEGQGVQEKEVTEVEEGERMEAELEMEAGIFLRKGFLNKNMCGPWRELQKGA